MWILLAFAIDITASWASIGYGILMFLLGALVSLVVLAGRD